MRKATETDIERNGFTLIEILVAIVILAIIALSLMALLPMGYRQVTQAGRLSVMSHLAHEKIDTLKGLGVEDSNLLEGTHPTNIPYRLTDPDLNGYSLRWTVTDNEPVTKVKTVVVEVGYLLYETDDTPIPASEQQFQLREIFVTYIGR